MKDEREELPRRAQALQRWWRVEALCVLRCSPAAPSTPGELRLTTGEPRRDALADVLGRDHPREVAGFDLERLVDRHVQAPRHAPERGGDRQGGLFDDLPG